MVSSSTDCLSPMSALRGLSLGAAWTVKELKFPKMNVDIPREKKKCLTLLILTCDGGLWRTSDCSSQFRRQCNPYMKAPKTLRVHCRYTILGWTATLHLHVPGSAKELKHVFKVNVSKPKVHLYPQFREWWDTESFTYNYNDAW